MTKEQLHVCFVLNSYVQEITDAKKFLLANYSLPEWCEAISRQGWKVTVLIRFSRDESFVLNGVNYFFLKDKYGPQLKFWQVSNRINLRAAEVDADVYHLHNMNKVLQHHNFFRHVKRPAIIQNHAENPTRKFGGFFQRKVLKKFKCIVLTARGQEDTWIERNLLNPNQIRFVLEGSTTFVATERLYAQSKTGLKGDLNFIWVGNLNARKDPLTILDGFRDLLTQYPEAKLYMIYKNGDLLLPVKALINSDGLLSNSVLLLGHRDRSVMEAHYNSAHYFVLGSHGEGSGYSAFEAIACGCVPIITDIPSFRKMTDYGRIGELWKCGDSDSFVQAVKKELSKPWNESSAEAIKFFQENLSYSAIAGEMEAVYLEALEMGT